MLSGGLGLPHYHVRYCADPDGSATSCSVWHDARNWDGGLVFDGPQRSGSTTSHRHGTNCALPSTGTNGKARAFFVAELEATLADGSTCALGEAWLINITAKVSR